MNIKWSDKFVWLGFHNVTVINVFISITGCGANSETLNYLGEIDLKVVAKGVIVLGLCAAVNANADDNGEYIGDDVKNLPLFDAQIHFKEPAWGPWVLMEVAWRSPR